MKRALHALAPRSRFVSIKRLRATRDYRWPCRCRRGACEARQTKAKHPSQYVRAPKCCKCGEQSLRVDWYRVQRECGVRGCRCGGYSFPHHRGRGYCHHNPKADHESRGKWS